MSTTLIIAARELREKSRIFLISAGLAVLPFLAAALPTSRGHRAEMIPILGGFSAIAMGLGLAVVLGATVVVSELAQRRASFYFSKPVSAASIWIGKGVAALITSVAAMLIIAVPAGLVPAGRQWEWLPRMTLLGGTLLAILVLFLVSHVVSTALRSHSPVLGIDFALLLGAIVALAFIARPLLVGGGLRVAGGLGLAIAAAVLLLFAVAPVWQLEWGRTDLRRSHAALSRVLWPGVAVVLLAAAGFVAWFVTVAPAQLVDVYDARQPATGDKVMVAGRAEHRGDFTAAFLLDRRTGEYERLGAIGWWGFRFSRDGRVAAWMAPAGFATFRNPAINELHLRHLNGRPGQETATSMRFHSPGFVLSDDGSRLAVASTDGLVVIDTNSLKILASTAAIKHRPWRVMFFPDPGHLRIIEVGESRGDAPTTLQVHELDVARKSLTMTGQRTVQTPTSLLSVSEDGSRMILRGSTEVLDGRTAAPVWNLGVEPAPRIRMATAMLSNGGVAVFLRADGGLQLRTFDRNGVPAVTVPLPGVAGGFVAGETADRRLLVFVRRGPAGSPAGLATLVVDLNRGVVERTLEGVRGPFPEWAPDPRLVNYARGQWVATAGSKDGVVMVNPATGERRGL